MVGVHTTTTTTRLATEDGEETATLLAIPPPVKEAIAMIESDSPLVAAEGFSKLSQATFNNQLMRMRAIPITMCWIYYVAVGKEAAGAVGAIKVIANAMARNIENGTVQEDGCRALRNVSFHCEQNLRLVREEGGIVAVLTAMDSHPENEALQAEGCWALLVFCSNQGTSATTMFIEKCSVAVFALLCNAKSPLCLPTSCVLFDDDATIKDENCQVAKPFLHVIDKAFAAYSSNSEIKSKCIFLKALLA